MKFHRVALLLIAAIPAAASAQTTHSSSTKPTEIPQYSVSGTLSVGGEGRWDYITVGPDHLLYVTRSTHTQIIEPNTGKVVGDITGGARLHGVAIVAKVNRGFITDGQAGKLIVFDASSRKALGEIAAADDADGIIYDAGTDRVLIGCGDAEKLLVLDPGLDLATAKCQTVELGGKPEAMTADGKGRAFVCLNDKNEIASVDLATLKVTARWKIGTGTGPTGIAIDPDSGVLFVGCRNKKMIVVDTTSGNVVAELPIGSGNDACTALPMRHEAFASCGDGTVTVIRETNLNKFEVVQTLQTRRGARTMAVDPSTGTLFLPTALFGPAAANERRPPPIPGSFMIVVAPPNSAAATTQN